MIREEREVALMRAGLNLIQQALSVFDSDMRLAVCNQRFQDMFDFPDALVRPGARFEDIIDFQVRRGEYGEVDDIAAAIRDRIDIARAFRPHYMERRRANGRWISVEGAPLAQGGWITVYTDITEVKLQEALLQARSEELSGELLAHAERLAQTNRELAATNAALAEAERELIELEARARLTTEMMPAHIAHVDRGLRYTYTNRRLSSVMPGRPNEILGRTGREVLGAETFAKILPALQRALEGESSVLEFSDAETGRRIRGAFTPDRIGSGPINGVYILSADVTEEVQARAALTQTRKRELAAQLTSGLAHDFGNLLTIILGLQGQLERAGLPPEQARLVQATLAAARRGGVLLDRIACISGRRALRPAPVDVAAFAAELRMLVGAALPPEISLALRVTDFRGPVLLDPGALHDALLNLGLNARDAIGAGASGEIRIALRPVRDTWVEIEVRDSGPGFSPEALDRGIDPFFSTKGGEGSGLGLSMVFDHVNLAGGSLRLANHPEGGGVVVLRLPLRRPGVVPSGGIVLLVEDSELIREAVRGMLQSLGLAVLEAASAEEAAGMVDLPGLALILSDINLGGGESGLALAERLAAAGSRVPLALMTALPPSDPEHQRAARRFPVLAKPVSPATLAGMFSLVAPGFGEVP